MRDYNFFERYKKKRIEIDFKSPGFVALVVAAGFAVACGALVYSNTVLATQVGALGQQVQAGRQNETYAEANILKGRVDTMRQYDEMADGVLALLMGVNTLGAHTLQTLTDALPESVTIGSAHIDHAHASFVFAAPDRAAAAELLLNLKNSGLFEDVALNTVTSTAGGVTVDITAVMKAGEVR